MGFVIGIALALAVGLLARLVRLDRDRALYPVAMIVIASYYILFAVLGGSAYALILETLVAVLFVALALWSFKSSLWLVAAALAAHGIFDLIHGAFITNPGVPDWWPSFCLAYDVTAAGYLAWLLTAGRMRAGA